MARLTFSLLFSIPRAFVLVVVFQGFGTGTLDLPGLISWGTGDLAWGRGRNYSNGVDQLLYGLAVRCWP